MAKNETATAPAEIPTFAPVAVATLAPAAREASADTLALGNAIFAVIADGTNAAQDPTVYNDKADATKRAAVLKRAVLATNPTIPAGKTVGARVTRDGSAYRVAVLLSDAKPRKNGKAS